MRWLLALMLIGGVAEAGPDADRCARGAAFAKAGDLPRAALYLDGCEHVADLPADVAKAAHDIKPTLRDSQLSSLDIITHPDGLAVEIDTFPGETLTAPITVWLPAGKHHLKATQGDRSWTQDVTTEPHKGTLTIIETGLDAKRLPPRNGSVDMADEPGGAVADHHEGSPPPVKHRSLMTDKQLGIPDAASGPQIDDPLAFAPASTATRDLWLGLRVGGGMFDDGAAAARAGLAVALTARYRVADRLFVAARTDWSRRGGQGALDALGASAGVGTPVGDTIAVIAQLRADLRLAGTRDAMPVSRGGVGAAISAELALPATPLTLGLRLEQAFTELVPGARDRAVLAELGVDWR